MDNENVDIQAISWMMKNINIKVISATIQFVILVVTFLALKMGQNIYPLRGI